MSKVILLTSITLSILLGFVSSYFIFNSEDSTIPTTLTVPTFENLAAPVNGLLYFPFDVAVNSTGYIYVADTGNSIIQVFTSSGDFYSTFAVADKNIATKDLNRPYGIHINGTGDETGDHIFVSDTFTGGIKIYGNATNAYISTFGTAGQGTDEFYLPTGLTTNSTHLFVADTNNHRIVIIDLATGLTVDTIP